MSMIMTWQSAEIAIVLILVAMVFLRFVREQLSPDVVAC